MQECGKNDIVCINIHIKYDESWILLGISVATCQLTRDPAMNPVTASVTFDIGGYLAKNVGIVVTCADMLPTFPTKYHHDCFLKKFSCQLL